MKKLIILLMAVSIMLTSCGKSAGLSNRNKGADNNPLSASTLKKLPQGTNYKNSKNVSKIDTIKRHLHTVSDFLSAHKFGLGVSSVLLILTGLVYYYRQDIFNNQKSEPEQIKKADKIVEKVNKLVSDNEALKRKNNGLNNDKKVLEQERDRLISEKSGLLNEGRQKSEAISRLEISDTEQKTKIAEDEQTIKDLSDHLKLLSEPDRLLRQNQDLFNQLKQGERDIQELSDQLDREKQDKQRLFEQTQAQSNENSLSEQLNQKEQEKLALFTQTQYQIEAIDRLIARNNDKANEITQLKINNEAQSREITRLKNENKTQSDMIQDYENLSQQNKTLLAEIERLKQALTEAEKNKA